MEVNYKRISGRKQIIFSKLILGGLIILVIATAIWFPVMFYAVKEADKTKVTKIEVEFRVPNYGRIIRIEATDSLGLRMLGEKQKGKLTDQFQANFLNRYDSDEIYLAEFEVKFKHSQPFAEDAFTLLEEKAPYVGDSVPLEFAWSIEGTPVATAKDVVLNVAKGVVSDTMTFGPDTLNPADTIVNATSNEGIVLFAEKIMPKAIIVKFPRILSGSTSDATRYFKKKDHQTLTIQMKYQMVESVALVSREDIMKQMNVSNTSRADSESIEVKVNQLIKYWEVKRDCSPANENSWLSQFVTSPDNCEVLYLLIFVDRNPPHFLNDSMSSQSMIGLYTTFVIVIFHLIRRFFYNVAPNILYDDMPDVDNILQLCLDIYLARESLEFILEEDLTSKLVFLFRSPETIIKWTEAKPIPLQQQPSTNKEEGGSSKLLLTKKND